MKKNFFIIVLLVLILLLSSFVYKYDKKYKKPVLNNFRLVEMKSDNNQVEPILYIYIFFSKKNCYDCLQIIKVLNALPYQFKVIGIVSANELENESEIRNITGATFDLISYTEKYKRFHPNYSPTIYGVGESGKIYFVIPAVPKEKEYFEKFLIEFYDRSFSLLLYEKQFSGI